MIKLSNPIKDFKKIIKNSSLALYIGAILIFVILAVICHFDGVNFVSAQNISNIVVQSAIIAIVGIGESIVIITSGIDLSVGSIVGFTGIFAGLLIKLGIPIGLACLIAVFAGVLIGLISGFGVTYGKIPAFIMTLGMLGIVRGAALAVNDGKPVANFPQELNLIANMKIFGISSFIFYVVILYVIIIIIMHKTKFGRHVYAIGGNEKAAKLSGVNVRFVQLMTYAVSGLFSGIAGVFLLSRMLYATPNAGDGYELDAIAAAVIGGVSLAGGSGKLFNTLIGALILTTLKAGLQMLNVPYSIQQMTTGIVIIMAVFFDRAKERKSE